MDVIYGLLPLMLLLGLVAVGVFFWAARSGQFEDMEGEASRILMDEDLTSTEKQEGETAGERTEQAQEEPKGPAA
jgi:cbb3-type cytochrome oxidase maturation protein